MSDRPADPRSPAATSWTIAVLVLVVVVLTVLLLDRQGLAAATLRAVPTAVWYAVVAGALGLVTGSSEIVSRYRDEPLHAVTRLPALGYIALNVVIALIAYGLLRRYGTSIAPGVVQDQLLTAIIAGLGGMAILRSKIFTYRTEAGDEIAVGPDALLTTFLTAADRAVDRIRASRRFDLVVDEVNRIEDHKEGKAYFQTALAAFQNLSTEEQTAFVATVDKLDDSAFPPRIRFQAMCYALLNLTGERNFRSIMGSLGDYAARHGTNDGAVGQNNTT